MNDNPLGRRDFLRAGIYASALLAGGSMVATLSGCSAPAGAAPGFLCLRQGDLDLLKPLVPVVLDGAFTKGDDDTLRALALLDGTLADASPTVRNAMFQLYDLLQLGAARWWLTGAWTHPANLTFEQRIGALEHWRDKPVGFAQIAFRGLTQPLMMVWYSVAENGRGIGYPGPPKKVVA